MKFWRSKTTINLYEKFPFKKFPLHISFHVDFWFFYIRGCEFIDAVELKSLDYRFRWKKSDVPSQNVVIVAIDEKSLKELGRWPWTRDVIAEGTRKLFELGASVIGFDIIFSEEEEFKQKEEIFKFLQTIEDEETREHLIKVINEIDPDKNLAKVFKTYKDKIVAGYFVFMRKEELGETTLKWTDKYLASSQIKVIINSTPSVPIKVQKAFAVENNIESIEKSVAHFGFFNVQSDEDGIYRRALLLLNIGGNLYPSLALEMLRVWTGSEILLYVTDGIITKIKVGDYKIYPDELGRIHLNYLGKGKTFPHYSFVDILKGRVSKEKIKDKMVLIGATAIGIYDLRPTPLDEVFPGVEIHATCLDNIIANRPIKRYEWMWTFEMLGIWTMFFFIGIAFLKTGPFFAILSSIGIIILFNILTLWLFLNGRIWVKMVYPNISLISLTLLLSFYKYLSEERMKRRVKHTFKHYLSDKLIEIMINNPEKLKLGGEKREITILFSDIRGFTSLSEKLPPESTATLLHEFLTPMTEIIIEHDGLLDKYIGDAIMALFGAPIWMESHAEKAVRASIEMVERLKLLNEEWKKKMGFTLRIGIGLNTGECIVGNMGSSMLFDYTAIGDAVNLASRIEGITKVYGVEIIATEFTVNKCGANEFVFRELDFIRVKGKEKPTRIYEVLGSDKELSDKRKKFLEEFQNSLTLYRKGDWDRAIDGFRKCLELFPEDSPSRIFIERCDKLKRMKIEDWEGIYEMEVK